MPIAPAPAAAYTSEARLGLAPAAPGAGGIDAWSAAAATSVRRVQCYCREGWSGNGIDCVKANQESPPVQDPEAPVQGEKDNLGSTSATWTPIVLKMPEIEGQSCAAMSKMCVSNRDSCEPGVDCMCFIQISSTETECTTASYNGPGGCMDSSYHRCNNGPKPTVVKSDEDEKEVKPVVTPSASKDDEDSQDKEVKDGEGDGEGASTGSGSASKPDGSAEEAAREAVMAAQPQDTKVLARACGTTCESAKDSVGCKAGAVFSCAQQTGTQSVSMADHCAGTCAVPLSAAAMKAAVAAMVAKTKKTGGDKPKAKLTMCDAADNGGCWVASDGVTKAQCAMGRSDEAMGVFTVRCACQGDFVGNGISCTEKPPMPSMAKPGSEAGAASAGSLTGCQVKNGGCPENSDCSLMLDSNGAPRTACSCAPGFKDFAGDGKACAPIPGAVSCHCFANGPENEKFCETSKSFPDAASCVKTAPGRCHWGPTENAACAVDINTGVATSVPGSSTDSTNSTQDGDGGARAQVAAKAKAAAEALMPECPLENATTGLTKVGVVQPGTNCQTNPNGEPPQGASPIVKVLYSCNMDKRAFVGRSMVDAAISRLTITASPGNQHTYKTTVVPADMAKPTKLGAEYSIFVVVSRPAESPDAQDINRDWCEAPSFDVWADLRGPSI